MSGLEIATKLSKTIDDYANKVLASQATNSATFFANWNAYLKEEFPDVEITDSGSYVIGGIKWYGMNAALFTLVKDDYKLIRRAYATCQAVDEAEKKAAKKLLQDE